MIARLRLWIEALRTSLWFVPVCLLVLAVGLAEALIRVDQVTLVQVSVMENIREEDARSMLQAIATSMITVAALAFSLTLAVLGQTSAQYTSRVIRSFIRDVSNQIVLGTLSGIYVYCLVVLGRLDNEGLVPHVAVGGALVGALVGVGVLVYFIHHIAQNMQVSRIVDSIEKDTLPAIERLHCMRGEAARDENAEDEAAVLRGGQRARIEICSHESGYVQVLDVPGLIEAACLGSATIEVVRAPGQFVMPGEPLAIVHGVAAEEHDALSPSRLRECFTLGSVRSIEADPSFGLRQLVDIALKALSPGVNDTTTGIMALDRLGTLLCAAVTREDPQRLYYRDGRLVVVVPRSAFVHLLGLALDQIRQSAPTNVSVMRRMAEILGRLRLSTSRPDRLGPIDHYRQRLARLITDHIPDPEDRAPVIQALDEDVEEAAVASRSS